MAKLLRPMRSFVLSAFAALGLASATAASARADVIVRDHRERRDVASVRIRTAPPVIRTEVRTRAPSPRHVWVPGYWNWRGGRHVWTGGRWRLPPTRGLAWIEPRWVNEGGEWVFYDGYWGSEQPVASTPPPGPPIGEDRWESDYAPPPVPREEAPPPAPDRGMVWIRGYWGWDGRQHVWVPGRWEASRPGWVWSPGRWVRYGHHWRWRAGRWTHR